MRTESARLVGREPELALLDDELSAALDGSTRSVVVVGDAGIGKSRVISEFITRVAGRALVASGQCVDLGTAPLPYAGLTGVLADLVAELGAERVLDRAGTSGPALGALLPALAGDRGVASDPLRIADALASTLAGIAADVPLVVVIEDLHWADGATLALLSHLLQSVTRARLLVVASYRRDDVGRRHPLRSVVGELERARLIVEVPLERISDDDVRRLAGALAGRMIEPVLLDELVARSEGVPFYVEELVPTLGSALPRSLAELLLGRYERLDPDTRRLLRVVSAGGVRVAHDTLARVVGEGRGEGELDETLREAIEAGMLEVDRDGYRFHHALLQEAVHAELLPGEGGRLHAAYARALEDDTPSPLVLAAIATHWDLARMPDRALASAVRARAAASAVLASPTAARLGERALELWSAVADAERLTGTSHHLLLADTANDLYLSGRVDRSRAMVEEALDEWPTADRRGKAQLLALASQIASQSGHGDGSIEVAAALRLLTPGRDDDVRASLLVQQARSATLAHRLDDAVSFGTEAIETADRAGLPLEESVAANLRGVARVLSGDVGGLDDLERARRLAGDDMGALLRYHVNFSNCLLLLGRAEDSLAVAEAGVRVATEVGGVRTLRSMLEGNAADALSHLGRWDEAETRTRRMLDFVDPSVFSAYLRARRVWQMLWQNGPEVAQGYVTRWNAELATFGRTESQVGLQLMVDEAHILIELGDPASALLVLEPALAADHGAAAPYDLPIAAAAARALAAVAADETAIAPWRAIIGRYSGWPTWPTWSALFAAELGESPWSEVVVAPGPAYLRPYALLRQGEAQLGSGDRTGARDSLSRAGEAARAIGMTRIVEAADRLIDEAGLLADRVRDPERLSVRENQVLDLIAEGLSNAQIAARLFISVKTVSVHVSSILRKTGSSSRTEAVARRGS